nr:NAD(P)-binding domain-containing protein [Tanacetum cinerariifolium]
MDLKSKVLIIGGTGYLGRTDAVVVGLVEDDIATYTIRTIDDPRTLNKTVYIRPPANILSQREIVEIWEKLIGKQLEKTYLSEQEFLDAIFVEEDDIATYTIRTIDDPRTLNKTLYIRPPANILSQREIVEIWENLIGKQLVKTSLSEQEFLDSIKEKGYVDQAGMTHFYHFFYEGCLANFEIGDDAEEACTLYPDVEYIKVEDYLKQYL